MSNDLASRTLRIEYLICKPHPPSPETDFTKNTEVQNPCTVKTKLVTVYHLQIIKTTNKRDYKVQKLRLLEYQAMTLFL